MPSSSTASTVPTEVSSGPAALPFFLFLIWFRTSSLVISGTTTSTSIGWLASDVTKDSLIHPIYSKCLEILRAWRHLLNEQNHFSCFLSFAITSWLCHKSQSNLRMHHSSISLHSLSIHLSFVSLPFPRMSRLSRCIARRFDSSLAVAHPSTSVFLRSSILCLVLLLLSLEWWRASSASLQRSPLGVLGSIFAIASVLKPLRTLSSFNSLKCNAFFLLLFFLFFDRSSIVTRSPGLTHAYKRLGDSWTGCGPFRAQRSPLHSDSETDRATIFATFPSAIFVLRSLILMNR